LSREREVALDARHLPRVVNRHRRLVDEALQQQQFEFAEGPFLVQVDVQRPDGLLRHDQREARHGPRPGSHLDRMNLQVFFVRQDAPPLLDGPAAHPVGARPVPRHRRRALARRQARRRVESVLPLVVDVDHG
jgi:hypothetical protein